MLMLKRMLFANRRAASWTPTTVLSLHQHKWRLHAALRSRHAEESSMAVRPLPVQSICARPRTSLATCHNARTHISPTSLYVKLPSKVTITYTTVPVFVDRIRRRMHNGCCNQATRIEVVNSRNFCIDASPHEWLAAKPHGKCKIPYHESRYLRVLSCRVVTYMYTCHRYAGMDASSASYLLSIRDIFSSPGTSPETNFARYLHADTTTTTKILVATIAIVVVLSCRVSKTSSRDFRHRKLQ